MRLDMDDGDDVGLDMGPLIDCVFLLLIFFLVSTTMKKPEPEIPIELPEPAISAQPNTDKAPTLIVIDQKGNFYWGAKQVGQEELHKNIKQVGQTNPTEHVRINVDRRSPSRFLVQVMDLCAFEGLKNYGIHTQDNKPDK